MIEMQQLCFIQYSVQLCYQFNHVGYNNAVNIAVSLGLRNNSLIISGVI